MGEAKQTGQRMGPKSPSCAICEYWCHLLRQALEEAHNFLFGVMEERTKTQLKVRFKHTKLDVPMKCSSGDSE